MFDKKTTFFTGIILVLVVIILLQRSCSGSHDAKPCDTNTVIKTDTVYRNIQKTDIKSVKVYKHDTVIVKEPWMVPDQDYARLKVQYQDLVKLYVAKNIYVDSIKIDTIGTLTVIDTVSRNMLLRRKYIHNYKIPTIIKTVEVERPPKRQMYMGGALGFRYPLAPASIQAGFLFKDKKDQIFGLHAGVDVNGNITYILSSYWKISFKNN